MVFWSLVSSFSFSPFFLSQSQGFWQILAKMEVWFLGKSIILRVLMSTLEGFHRGTAVWCGQPRKTLKKAYILILIDFLDLTKTKSTQRWLHQLHLLGQRKPGIRTPISRPSQSETFPPTWRWRPLTGRSGSWGWYGVQSQAFVFWLYFLHSSSLCQSGMLLLKKVL